MIALPGYLDQDTWDSFEEMRRLIKKPMTDRARKLILYELQRIKDGGHCPNKALDQSILHCWSDVFEPREKPVSKVARTQAAETVAFLARREEISSSPEVRAAAVGALKLVRGR